MAQTRVETSYNERLFQGRNLRTYLHNARFEWFRKQLRDRAPTTYDMIEIGCFDGKLLDFCPHPPLRYIGFDAGWEGGLDEARKRYIGHPTWRFEKAINASALSELPNASFQVAAAMETIEHIPPQLVDGYLSELARVVNGWFFVTVPNEKGIVFLLKWITKKTVLGAARPYTVSELVNATLGRMDKVERDQHKGFDYSTLARHIGRHFDIVAVEAIPLSAAPTWTGFTIGIVARSRFATAC